MTARDAGPITWDGDPPKPFTIAVPDRDLVDLRDRLGRTRWPDRTPGPAWAFGAEPDYLRALCAYWRDGYDWRRHEAALNQLPNFKVTIGGIGVHFIHIRGENDSPRPLLLAHGWPGSFYEYHALIPRLTHPSRFGGDPADAFSVVVPSLPGHGFSFAPDQRRFGLEDMASVLSILMTEVLGYPRFRVHGHDWGSFLATRLGYAYAARILGIHITLLAVPRDPAMVVRSPEEQRFQDQLNHWLKDETGYSQIMGTKPQTLAYGLSDSPAGLAAWILEKFRTWSDCDGDVDRHFGRDVLITNLMLYWLTGAIGASCWPYYARLHGPWIVPPGEAVRVPTAYAEHPREILTPPRSIAEKTYADIRRWTRMESGGHFAALENPDALARDIRAFFRTLDDGSSQGAARKPTDCGGL